MSDQAKGVDTTLAVSGMSCGMCVKHVTKALERVPGVSRAVVTLDPPRAVVTHDPARADTGALVAAVRGAGYDAVAR